MGIEPTSAVWKTAILAVVLHPHMEVGLGIEPKITGYKAVVIAI